MSLWDKDEPPQDRVFVWDPRDLTPEEREDFKRIVESSGTRLYDPERDKPKDDE